MAVIPLGKVAITPKGDYHEQTYYEKLDVVGYQGSSYLAVQGSLGIPPPDEAYWMLMAEKGDRGVKGNPGADASVEIGTVTTGEPGTDAQIENVGTGSKVVLNVTIPRGDKGEGSDITGHNQDPGAHGGVLSIIPQIKIYPLVIPAAGWQAEVGGGYFFELDNDILREVHHVEIIMSLDSVEAAAVCGMSPVFEVLDGRLRFAADYVPGKDLTGEYLVIACSGSLMDGLLDFEIYAASDEDVLALLS